MNAVRTLFRFTDPVGGYHRIVCYSFTRTMHINRADAMVFSARRIIISGHEDRPGLMYGVWYA